MLPFSGNLEGNWKSLSRNLSNAVIADPNESDMERRETHRRMTAVKVARENYNPKFIRQYLKKALEEDTLGKIRPSVGVKFDSLNSFQMKIFLDLRWGKFRWQREMEQRNINPKTGLPYRFAVSQIPRRHGKTYGEIHFGRDYLITTPWDNPIGAYYCPVKDQAIRNSWKIFEIALAPVPGHVINKSRNYMTFLRPTLSNPKDFVTIYFFGIVGGSGSKRGGYYNWAYFDEIEFIDRAFIAEAGINSVFDRKGIVRMTGTPHGHGELQYWLDESKKRETLRKAIEGRVAVHDRKKLPDVDEWISHEEDCWSLKVYSKTDLESIRATVGTVTFQQEMECIDSLQVQGYYHRRAIKSLEKSGGVSPWIQPDPNLPLRAYFDLGLGTKSDRMAFVICQFGRGYIQLLYGQNVFEKGYAAAISALSQAPHIKKMGLFEVVLPHDSETSEQSDAIQKIEKFRDEMRKQGFVSTEVRPMPRSSDKLMDINTTTEMIPYMRIHEIDCMEVLEALRGHKKKFLKKEMIFVQEPAKTKYRDLADACRLMSVDYKHDTFTKAQMSEGGHGWVNPMTNIRPEKSHLSREAVEVGFHPAEGSVIIGASGPEAASTGMKWVI